jgi:subtilisin-like proprotein convertase family protein
VAIPDGAAAGVTVPLTVSGVGNVARATFSIDGSSCSTAVASPLVGLDHTFVGDLVGSLVAPDGTSVTLFDRRGLDGNNICQAVFDDTAARSITSAESGDAPFTGSWRPESPLAGLNGHSADGTWNFHVVDEAALDVGSVRAFTLHVSGFVS